MAKKLTLTTPHNSHAGTVSYQIVTLTVQYENDIAFLVLQGDDGRLHKVTLSPAPATTQEQAILALINNGVLSGTIGDA